MLPWYLLAASLLTSVAAGIVAVRRPSPTSVFVSGLLLNVAGTSAWVSWRSESIGALLQMNALCLAAGSAVWTLVAALFPERVGHLRLTGRTVAFAHVAAQSAILLLGVVAASGVARSVLSLPPLELQPLDWITLAAVTGAVVVLLWDRTTRFPLAGLYALGFLAMSLGQIQRGYSPGTFFVWGGVCEWAGFALVAALLGWLLPRIKFAAVLRIPDDPTRGRQHWFLPVQAVLSGVTAALAVWISVDFRFHGMGQDVALFGLSGRQAGCPAALMLIGTAILMAWQTHGVWRGGWQYAALAAGVLFTSSIGWSRVEAASWTAWLPWFYRCVNLLLSSSMMTLMTGFGLAQVLPRGSDWVARGRRAMPVFGCLALLMLLAVLVQGAVLLAM